MFTLLGIVLIFCLEAKDCSLTHNLQVDNSFKRMLRGYKVFRQRYALGDKSVMQSLSQHGQKPEVMVIACCDSRVDPALILQCAPGDLFVVRNVANIVPPYEKDDAHHGTSAALEFGTKFLGVKHLILLGHSQCGGIQALLNMQSSAPNDFITKWVSLIKVEGFSIKNTDECAKLALGQSYQNCLTFPWIHEKVKKKTLQIHLWFFDISTGQILAYSHEQKGYFPVQ